MTHPPHQRLVTEADIGGYIETYADPLLATLVPRPAGGSEGQALIKQGSSVVWGDVATITFATAYHDSDANYPRPAATTVMWVGTVNPVNRIAGDIVALADPAPLPDVVVWSDSGGADGALTTTMVGAKSIGIAGTGYAAGVRSGGTWKFGGGSPAGVGIITVDSGAVNGIFRGKIATKGANNQAGFVFRMQDILNHYVVSRVSAGDTHYCIKKRTAGAYTTVATLAATMTDADVWEVDLSDTTAIIKINDVEQFNGAITGYPTATTTGVFCGASTSATEMAYDDLSFTVPA